MGRRKKRSLISTPPAPSTPAVEDPSDRQNLADTVTASAAEAQEALAEADAPTEAVPEPPTESDLPTESALEPETTDLAKTTGLDDPQRAEDAPENPAGSKQELLSTTPPPTERAAELSPFDTKPEEDKDWFLATGAPAPHREEPSAMVDEPEIVVAQRDPVLWAVVLAGLFFGFLLLMLVLWFVAT